MGNVLEEGQENAVSEQKRPDSDQKSDQKSDQIKMIFELIKENPKISRSDISHTHTSHAVFMWKPFYNHLTR